MKTITAAAFASLLLAGASTQALAQDHDHGDRGDRGQGHAAQAGQAGQAAPQAAPPAAPQQHQGPQGPQSPQGGHARFGAPPSAGQAPSGQAPAAAPQAQPQGGQPRFERGAGAGRQWDRERGPREVIPPATNPGPVNGGDRRFENGRGDNRLNGPVGRPDERRDGRDNRWNGDHRDGDNRNWDRGDHRDNNRGDGHNPWGGHGARWQANRYPPVFWSQDRFRIGAYRQPYGYYVRTWGFGDFLPRGWYGADYFIGDFLDYDLPYPPPGYEWVRVGGDALMIDRFTGRIVQVVRGIFW